MNDPLPRAGSRDWSPAHPEFATPNERGLYDAPPTNEGAPWEPAPASSHLEGWKLLSGGFVAKFYGPSAGAPAGTVAVLMLAFRAKGKAPRSQYEYYFTSQTVAETYLDKLRTAEHPGHVVQELIAQSVPYKKTH